MIKMPTVFTFFTYQSKSFYLKIVLIFLFLPKNYPYKFYFNNENEKKKNTWISQIEQTIRLFEREAAVVTATLY